MALDFSDVIKVIGRIVDWQNDKTDQKAQEAWNAYNRQVDILALNGLKAQLARRDAILTKQIQTSWRRHELMARRIQLTRSSASLRRTLERERAHDAENEAGWRAAEARAELGLETERVNQFGEQIAAGYDQLAADKLALRRTFGANTAAIVEQLGALQVERGVFTEEQADKLKVLAAMSNAIEVNVGGARGTFAARQQLLIERVGLFDLEEQILGRETAIRRAELREGAVLQEGAAVAGGAARTGGGSFAITEAARVQRGLGRAEARLADATLLAQQRIGVGRTEIRAEWMGLEAGLASTIAQAGVQRAEVGADLRGVGRAERRFGAAQAVERSRLGAAHTAEQARLLTGKAEERGRERDLRAQLGVLRARRDQLTVAGGAIGAAKARGVRAARRISAEAEQDYANAQAEAAALTLERQDIRTDIDKLWSEQLDKRYEKEVADWQRDIIEKLPMKGSSRGALGLLLQIAADVAD